MTRRVEALDGLRGVAILLVVLCHLYDVSTITGGAALGSAGVTAFFTLSGFLITSLLLAEHARSGRIDLGSFYARRARRLGPALVVVLVLVGSFEISAGFVGFNAVPPVALYFANWFGAAGGDLGLLPHTWSLAIEEQFYISWSILLILVRRWRWGPEVACASGILASFALRFLLWDDGANAYRVYVGTDTRADGLLVGCLLACCVRRGLKALPGGLATAATLGLVLAGTLDRTLAGTDLLVPSVAPWLTALAIWAALSTPPRWMSTGVLCYLGRRSYAIYLWHFALLLALVNLRDSTWMALLAVALAVGAAELSWRFVEYPFSNMGKGRPPAVAKAAGANPPVVSAGR
jgi:peptidoglycan/LPS O-acetylase OafA/YrhL